jgi:hypothetical protein
LYHKYNVSIISPAIRKEKWMDFYLGMAQAIGKYSFEWILTGPIEPDKELLNKPNVKHVKDYGHPTRCTQIASIVAEGELLGWESDDGIFIENGLELAVDMWYQSGNPKNQVILKYLEGPHPNMPDMTASGLGYWHAWFHDGLKFAGIPKHYMCAGLGMLQTEYFRKLGGFDCRFENINMCCHDLSFRIQHDGGQLLLPPKHIMWNEWSSENGGIIVDAYNEQDFPLFKRLYNQSDILTHRIYLDYNNWMYNSSPVWARRFDLPKQLTTK